MVLQALTCTSPDKLGCIDVWCLAVIPGRNLCHSCPLSLPHLFPPPYLLPVDNQVLILSRIYLFHFWYCCLNSLRPQDVWLGQGEAWAQKCSYSVFVPPQIPSLDLRQNLPKNSDLILTLSFKIWGVREVLGGPVVKTPQLHCQGRGFSPWSGN